MNETTNQDMPPNRDTIDDCSSATEAGDVILGYAPLVGDYETVCVLISPDGEMGFGVGASLMKVDDQHTQVNFVVFGFDSQPTVEQPAETLWVIFERDSSFVVGGDLLSVSSLDIPCPALATMPRSEQDGESDGLEDDFVLYVSFLNGSFYALSGQIGRFLFLFFCFLFLLFLFFISSYSFFHFILFLLFLKSIYPVPRLPPRNGRSNQRVLSLLSLFQTTPNFS